MFKMNLQLFAHKKGVGSTKNGRDSESKRLGAKRADGPVSYTHLDVYKRQTFGIRSIYETSGCRTSEGAGALCTY